MTLKIIHKRSINETGGVAEAPLPSDLEYGELGVNYVDQDPALFIKDSADNIIKIAGPTSVGVPTQATETASGIAELATQAEVDAGTDNTRIVTPLTATSTFVNVAGDTMTGTLSAQKVLNPITDITGTLDLDLTSFWNLPSAIAIPDPTNADPGQSGIIIMQAAPTGWGTTYKFAGGAFTAPTAFPAVVPFFVVDATNIFVGPATEGYA